MAAPTVVSLVLALAAALLSSCSGMFDWDAYLDQNEMSQGDVSISASGAGPTDVLVI